MRTMGIRLCPSARTIPPAGSPANAAESRPGQGPDPYAFAHDVDATGRGPLVVVTERPEGTGQGGVGGDVHQRGAETQGAELAELQP